MEFRARRSGKTAKYGGFNRGARNKGGRRWTPSTAARYVQEYRSNSVEHRAGRSKQGPRNNGSVRSAVAARHGSVGSGGGRSPPGATGGDWHFQAMLRSTLGRVVRRAPTPAQIAAEKAAYKAQQRRAASTDLEPQPVPSLSSMCATIIARYADCVADPAVFRLLSPDQREHIMAVGGGNGGVSADVFRNLCGDDVLNATIRGAQATDEFVRELVPRRDPSAQLMDVDALAGLVSSSSDSSDEGGAGTSNVQGYLGGAVETKSGDEATPDDDDWLDVMEVRAVIARPRSLGCRRLKSLRILSCAGVSAQCLGEVLGKLPVLERLQLRACMPAKTPVAFVMQQIACSPTLRHLSITECQWLHFSAVEELRPLCKLQGLETVELSGCSLAAGVSAFDFRQDVCKRLFRVGVKVTVKFRVYALQQEAAGGQAKHTEEWED